MIPCHAVAAPAARRSTLLAEALHRVAASKYTCTRVVEHEPGTAAGAWATAQDRDTAAARSATQGDQMSEETRWHRTRTVRATRCAPVRSPSHEDSSQ